MRMKFSVLKRLGLGALFATCFAGLAWAQGAAQFDGQYTGELRLARTFSGDCTEPPFGALYPLTVAAGVGEADDLGFRRLCLQQEG